MHLCKNWLAVVRRQVLEIYLTPGYAGTGRFKHHQTLSLPHVVGSASFSQLFEPASPLPPSKSLRLCISCDDGISVYRVLCDPSQSLLSLDCLLHHKPTPLTRRRRSERFAFDATLGVTGGSASWLCSPNDCTNDLFTFVTVRVPSGEMDGESPLFEWSDKSMPVQYCLGVRDFDEARSLAVFGNAYGELCLCDFSGSKWTQLQGCYIYTIKADCYNNEELLPTVSPRPSVVYYIQNLNRPCRPSYRPFRLHHFLIIVLFRTRTLTQRFSHSGDLIGQHTLPKVGDL